MDHHVQEIECAGWGDDQLAGYMAALDQVDFDVARPMWKVTILNGLELSHGVANLAICNIGHVIGDGISLSLVLNQLFDRDNASSSSSSSSPPPPPPHLRPSSATAKLPPLSDGQDAGDASRAQSDRSSSACKNPGSGGIIRQVGMAASFLSSAAATAIVSSACSLPRTLVTAYKYLDGFAYLIKREATPDQRRNALKLDRISDSSRYRRQVLACTALWPSSARRPAHSLSSLTSTSGGLN